MNGVAVFSTKMVRSFIRRLVHSRTGKRMLVLCAVMPLLVHAQDKYFNTGQAFTCITVDSNYNIWAGTARTGLYQLNKLANPGATQFSLVSSGSLSNFNIQTLAADANGFVWAGHNGTGGGTAAGGGIERINKDNPADVKHYSPDRNAECFTFFARDGLASLNSASIAVDKNGTVWSAHRYHDLTVTGGGSSQYILTPGSLSYKFSSAETFITKGTYEDYRRGADLPELPYPAYTCNPLSQTAQARTCNAVAVGANEVWLGVFPYTAKNGSSFPARLLKYDLAGTYIRSYDFSSIGVTPGGVFSSIWVTPKGDVWTLLSAGKGFAILKDGVWHSSLAIQNLACVLPAGAAINPTALWGNKLGQVFMGTSRGVLIYNGKGHVDSSTSYSFYSAGQNPMGENILAGVSEKDSVQWLSTSNGIIRTTLSGNYPLSIEDVDYTSCGNKDMNEIETLLKGNGVNNRKDYHEYEVVTEICSAENGVNRGCNAENIYKMMKANVAFTAPTPAMFTRDNLPPSLLAFTTAEELTEMLANVNARKPSDGQINYIRDVLTVTQKIKAGMYFPGGRGGMPLARPLDYFTRSKVEASQKAANPTEVISCNQEYRLYSSANHVMDRQLYKYTVDLLFCGNKLESPQYDKVWIFADDKNLTITNYTKEGHFLFPGKIVRKVVEECGSVKIITRGIGLNYCGDNTFGRINANGNVILGSILFKNIDLLLKRSFDSQTD